MVPSPNQKKKKKEKKRKKEKKNQADSLAHFSSPASRRFVCFPFRTLPLPTATANPNPPTPTRVPCIPVSNRCRSWWVVGGGRYVGSSLGPVGSWVSNLFTSFFLFFSFHFRANCKGREHRASLVGLMMVPVPAPCALYLVGRGERRVDMCAVERWKVGGKRRGERGFGTWLRPVGFSSLDLSVEMARVGGW
ncbi:hypothetical protein L209DRAFT_418755 [Thermothelomyces heterothallicus CBS 203.75]